MNIKDVNKTHFDEIASTWEDDPRHVQLGQDVARAIVDAIDLTRHRHVLEFGAGTGLLTVAIAPKVHDLVVLDSSTEMLNILRNKCAHLALRNVSIVQGSVPEAIPQDKFDLIYGSMTLHHVEDAQGALQAFADHLKPGGSVAIADIYRGDGSFQNDAAGVAHHGFHREELHHWLAQAGFGGIKFQTISTLEHTNRDDGTTHRHPVFLATASRA